MDRRDTCRGPGWRTSTDTDGASPGAFWRPNPGGGKGRRAESKIRGILRLVYPTGVFYRQAGRRPVHRYAGGGFAGRSVLWGTSRRHHNTRRYALPSSTPYSRWAEESVVGVNIYPPRVASGHKRK